MVTENMTTVDIDDASKSPIMSDRAGLAERSQETSPSVVDEQEKVKRNGTGKGGKRNGGGRSRGSLNKGKNGDDTQNSRNSNNGRGTRGPREIEIYGPSAGNYGAAANGNQTTCGSSGSNSQLEQLENTNLLTIRIKWINPENLMDDYKSHLLNRNNEAILMYRGVPINPSIIENYEYFSDKKRLEILKENDAIYTFELSTEEYAKSYDEKTTSSAWLYDLVIQAQFKAYHEMTNAREVIKELLRSNDHVERWSISENPHALTRPGNLYVRGIPKDLTVDDLVPIFSKFGPLLSLKIIVDSNTGDSLGYGFISYPLGSQAAKCIKELNGNLMNGSPLFINYHVERKERERIHLDHLKEDNDDERFRGVFVGNLPTTYENGSLITPEEVFIKFKEILDPVEILSYYFPKRNSDTNIEYKDDGTDSQNHNNSSSNDSSGESGDRNGQKDTDSNATDKESVTTASKGNVETCSSQNEDSPLKGFGFIKFSTHDMALNAIEVLGNYNWLGHILVVNKAVQNKCFNNNAHSHHYRPSSGRMSVSSRQLSVSGIPIFGPPAANSAMYPPPGFPMFATPFPVSPTGSEGLVAERSPVRSSSSGDASPRVNSIGQLSLYPTPPGAHMAYPAEPLTGPPRSRRASLYLPTSVYSTASTAPESHGQYGRHSSVHAAAAAAAAAAAFGGLPIPTRDQQESNLYVKHLPLAWKDEDLSNFYSQYGEIISAKIITVGGSKRENIDSSRMNDGTNDSDIPFGTSRGYGFVCFKNPLDASRAMMATDRFQVDQNHVLYVSFAQKRGKSVSSSSSSMTAPSSSANNGSNVTNRRNNNHSTVSNRSSSGSNSAEATHSTLNSITGIDSVGSLGHVSRSSSSGRSNSHSGHGHGYSHGHGHNHHKQNTLDSFVGNYNPKFLNAMLQQQPHHHHSHHHHHPLNGTPTGIAPEVTHRGSWGGPNQPPSYMVPVVLSGPSMNVPRAAANHTLSSPPHNNHRRNSNTKYDGY